MKNLYLSLFCALALLCLNNAYSQEGSSHIEPPPESEGSGHKGHKHDGSAHKGHKHEGSGHKDHKHEGSGHKHHEGSAHKKMASFKGYRGVKGAVAFVRPTEGNKAQGTVQFLRNSNNSIHITAHVEGLTPNAKHAIHIHEFGDCSSGDGKSAGGHYNPEGVKHAGPHDEERHAGDLGNLTADENGIAHYELTVDNITLGGRRNPIIGHAVIIHAGEDDLKSQPTGDAGGRIGCGIIGVQAPSAE